MSKAFEFDDEDGDDREEDYRPRRKQKSASGGASILRFISPGTFGIALLLFFLPWTDLGCSGPTGKMQFVTQSGLQSATGGHSEGSSIAELKKMQGNNGGKKGGEFKLNDLNPAGKNGKEEDVEKAPLLWIYLVLLVVGIVVPVFIAAAKLRGAIALGAAGAAVLLLIGQSLIGFPLSTAASKANTAMKDQMKQMGEMGARGGAAAPGMPGMPNVEAKMTSGYLISFWISIVLLLGTGVLGLMQLLAGGGSKSRPEKRRREELDDDDEFDEEEDERPRRR